ncbi:hypothetical protein ACFYP4_02250 [Streptomyces sp. NPDC005551]|uniref:hypothetical protein n=1 Tax=Streptomyces sp. NPDC005551 TaxID=3364725 RepID=UPI00367F6E0B
MSGPDDLTPEEQATRNRERNLRKIAEQWAEHEASTLELEELRRIPAPSPAQLRRIAELVEGLNGKGHALPCWQAAADAGDQDAQDYLAEWDTDLDTDPIVSFLRKALLRSRSMDEVREALRRLATDHEAYQRDVEEIQKMKPEDFE